MSGNPPHVLTPPSQQDSSAEELADSALETNSSSPTLPSGFTIPLAYPHIGPHLRNERMTENWAYGRLYAKLGIYQYGRERWLRSNITSGLSSCTQVFELA